jgi:glycosyltransferase involved in cell wall biosynthesis
VGGEEEGMIDILFVSTFRAPFIEEDLDVLSGNFHVRPLSGRGIGHALRIALGVFRSDIVFCWFASVYASIAVMIARFAGNKSVVVLGGVDIARNEELGYGIWLSRWKSKFVRYGIRHADRILISDGWMKERAVDLARYPGENIVMLPAGFDFEFWRPSGQKDNHVLTVAAASTDRRLRVKGIDVLIEAARLLPKMTFIVAGVDADVARAYDPPSNVSFYPVRPRKELLSLYQEAKVYCQPSREEAFCYTLREAMLCGCVPVTSEVGGMPTVVRGIGVLVPPGDVESLVAGILQSMNMKEDVSEKARSRVIGLYPKEKRDTDLRKLIESFAR